MNASQTQYLKIGLVIVLAITFLAVIADSVRRLSSSPSSRPAHPAAAIAAPDRSPVAEAPDQRQSGDWPTFELADIVAYNPFEPTLTASERPATAGTSAAKAARRSEATAAEGASAESASAEAEREFPARIQVVYQRGNRSAVIIDSHTLRPGDALEGGGRILEIDQHGVVVEIGKP